MSMKDRVSAVSVSPLALVEIDPAALPRRGLVLDLGPGAGAGAEIARLFDDAVLVGPDELRAQWASAAADTCLAYPADGRLPEDQLAALLAGPSAVSTVLACVSRETASGPAVPQGWSPRGRVVADGVTALVLERAGDGAEVQVDEQALRRALLGADGEPAHLARNAAALSEAARANRSESTVEVLEQQLQRAQQDLDRVRTKLVELRRQRNAARDQLRRLQGSPLGFLAVLSEKVQRRGVAALAGTAGGRRVVRLAAALGAGLLVLAGLCWAVAAATSSGYPGAAVTAVAVLVAGDVLLGIRGRRALARNLRGLNTTTRNGITTHRERLDDVRRGNRELSRLARQAAERQSDLLRQVELLAATSTDVAAWVRRSPAAGGTAAGSRELTLQTFVHDQLLRGVARSSPDLEADLRRVASSIVRQTQALTDLYSLVEPRRAVPQLGGWAVSPDALLLLVDELLQLRPRTVVECGSGSSTLWLALAVRRYGLATRIIALEHQEKYRQQTIDLLAAHGVEDVAEVRAAPLREGVVPDHPTDWYDPQALEGIEEVGLLFVDGPPEVTGPLARFPAVPLLRDRLAGDVTIVLDDTIRPDETKIAELWAQELDDFDVEHLPLDKGAAVFRRRR